MLTELSTISCLHSICACSVKAGYNHGSMLNVLAVTQRHCHSRLPHWHTPTHNGSQIPQCMLTELVVNMHICVILLKAHAAFITAHF